MGHKGKIYVWTSGDREAERYLNWGAPITSLEREQAERTEGYSGSESMILQEGTNRRGPSSPAIVRAFGYLSTSIIALHEGRTCTAIVYI